MDKGRKDESLGFRKTKWTHEALLAKHAWRILRYPVSMVAKLFLSKDCVNENFISVKDKADASWIWKGIFQGIDLIVRGLNMQIGDIWHINTVSGRGMARICH